MKTHRPPLASFLAFELRRVLRSPGVLVWTLAFPVVFYLVNFANKTNNPGAERWAGTTWAVYFMVSMCAWAAIAAASNAGGARLAAERASGWTRHLRLTPLPSWAYVAGKVLTGADPGAPGGPRAVAHRGSGCPAPAARVRLGGDDPGVLAGQPPVRRARHPRRPGRRHVGRAARHGRRDARAGRARRASRGRCPCSRAGSRTSRRCCPPTGSPISAAPPSPGTR